MKDEIEVKIRLDETEIEEVVRMIEEAAFEESHPRALEKNILFDRNDEQLRTEGKALRLRDYGSTTVLTYKGPLQQDESLKIRAEEEVRVGSFEGTREILTSIGFRESFRYDKWRRKFAAVIDGEDAEICIDETPVGNFLEIESSRQIVLQLARQFGWQEKDFLVSNYPTLYREADLGKIEKS